MSGFDNEVVYASNVDFSGAPTVNPTLITDGKMLIASSTPNTHGTHINVGTITSSDGSIDVTYVNPNIDISSIGGIVSLGGVTMDLTIADNQVDLFTTGSKRFVVVGISFVGVDVDTVTESGQLSIGWTAPLYNDVGTITVSSLTTTDETIVQIPFPGDTIPPVPVSTTVKATVATPVGATADVEKVYLIGFYI